MRGLRRTFSVSGLTNPRPGVRVEIESFQEKWGREGVWRDDLWSGSSSSICHGDPAGIFQASWLMRSTIFTRPKRAWSVGPICNPIFSANFSSSSFRILPSAVFTVSMSVAFATSFRIRSWVAGMWVFTSFFACSRGVGAGGGGG